MFCRKCKSVAVKFKILPTKRIWCEKCYYTYGGGWCKELTAIYYIPRPRLTMWDKFLRWLMS